MRRFTYVCYIEEAAAAAAVIMISVAPLCETETVGGWVRESWRLFFLTYTTTAGAGVVCCSPLAHSLSHLLIRELLYAFV